MVNAKRIRKGRKLPKKMDDKRNAEMALVMCRWLKNQTIDIDGEFKEINDNYEKQLNELESKKIILKGNKT